jgi:hypothetical protein
MKELARNEAGEGVDGGNEVGVVGTGPVCY